jgi:hypothetical protein
MEAIVTIGARQVKVKHQAARIAKALNGASRFAEESTLADRRGKPVRRLALLRDEHCRSVVV